MVFMYDDVATSALNPRQGVIINHPQGEDVYAGVPKVPLSGLSFYHFSPRQGETLGSL